MRMLPFATKLHAPLTQPKLNLKGEHGIGQLRRSSKYAVQVSCLPRLLPSGPGPRSSWKPSGWQVLPSDIASVLHSTVPRQSSWTPAVALLPHHESAHHIRTLTLLSYYDVNTITSTNSEDPGTCAEHSAVYAGLVGVQHYMTTATGSHDLRLSTITDYMLVVAASSKHCSDRHTFSSKLASCALFDLICVH